MTGDEESKKLILEIAKRIAEQYEPKKIILFGSYAYGEPTQDSDVDLLIIKNTDKQPIDRGIEVKKLLRGVAPYLPVSPLVYTEEEIAERNIIKDFFIEEVFEKEETLYGCGT